MQREKEYKRYCTIRSYIIKALYLWEELAKNYAYIMLGLIGLGIYVPSIAFKIATPVAVVGSICAFVAKWYHVSHTKFRKHGFYKRRK